MINVKTSSRKFVAIRGKPRSWCLRRNEINGSSRLYFTHVKPSSISIFLSMSFFRGRGSV